MVYVSFHRDLSGNQLKAFNAGVAAGIKSTIKTLYVKKILILYSHMVFHWADVTLLLSVDDVVGTSQITASLASHRL